MTHFAVPTVNLMIIKSGQVLLSRRANTGWMDGHLVLPGGHVEAGETPAKAMMREAKEELGIDIKPSDLMFVCVAVRNQAPQEHIAFEFKLDGATYNPTNNEPKKCSELVWADLTSLPTDIVPDFRTIIDESLQNTDAYIEVGYK